MIIHFTAKLQYRTVWPPHAVKILLPRSGKRRSHLTARRSRSVGKCKFTREDGAVSSTSSVGASPNAISPGKLPGRSRNEVPRACSKRGWASVEGRKYPMLAKQNATTVPSVVSIGTPLLHVWGAISAHMQLASHGYCRARSPQCTRHSERGIVMVRRGYIAGCEGIANRSSISFLSLLLFISTALILATYRLNTSASYWYISGTR